MMLRKEITLSTSQRSLSQAQSSSTVENDAYFMIGMSVGIISFFIGLVVLLIMEYFKHKVESSTLSRRVGVAPLQNEKFHADMVENFEHDDDSETNHNRNIDIRPTESTIEEEHQRKQILEEQKALRQQWRQDKSNKNVNSTKESSKMPTKLMGMLTKSNAQQQQQQHSHEDDNDDDDHDDELSVYSFPSALSSDFSDH